MAAISAPYELYNDIDGDPLESGKIYIGQSGLNPKTTPIEIFSDIELTQSVAQPVITSGGVPYANGTPINIFTRESEYSITVENKNGTLVYTELNATDSATYGDALEFSTIADVVSGNALNSDSTVDYADYVSGGNRKVSTIYNNSTSKAGGAEYVIKTLTQAALDGDIIDGSGAPDYVGLNHAVNDGTHCVVLEKLCRLDLYSVGLQASTSGLKINTQNAIDKLMAAASSGVISKIEFPKGEFSFLNMSIPSNCTIVGQGAGNTIFTLFDSELIPSTKADPTVGDDRQIYKPFVHTESIGTYLESDQVSNIHIKGVTFNWDNNRVRGRNGNAVLWLSNIKDYSVKECNFINVLPSDHSSGRSASLLISYSNNGHISTCRFEEDAGYEELGIRYSNKDITITKCLFAGKGPTRHNLEIAAVRDHSTIASAPENIRIENNTFRLHGRKQDCISAHDTSNIIITNNSFEVMEDLIEDTGNDGFRCLVKKFGGNLGGALIQGNTFDFNKVPLTIKQAFECVRIWAADMVVTGNFIRGRLSGFDNTYDPVEDFPLIGTSSSHNTSYANCVVSNNVFEIREYTAVNTQALIKCTGQNWVIHGNALTLAAQKIQVSNNNQAMKFIEVDGTPASGGFPRGLIVSVKDNISFSNSGNSYGKGVYIHGSDAEFYVVKDNILGGSRTRVSDQTNASNSDVGTHL